MTNVREKLLTPLPELQLRESVGDGATVKRVVVEPFAEGFRVVIYSARHRDPLTVGRYRGGIRVWAQIGYLIAWIERSLPKRPIDTIELYLPPKKG